MTRWGFLSCGRVAHDFANALKVVPGAILEAVATRDKSQLGRASAFAAAHGFRKAVGTYAEVLNDPEVDVVYLSALHSERVAHVTMILQAGKHVLVEKPLACSYEDAKKLVALARKKKVFLMEGMWTRFFPAVEKARALIEAGVIGAVTGVLTDFGFDAADVGAYPADPSNPRDGDPIYHKSLGGGALLWAGPYPIAAGLLPFGATEPTSFAAAGVVDASQTGVDLSCTVVLTFDKPGGVLTHRPTGCPARGALVTCTTAVDAETNETTTYVGTKGRITIQSPGHCPTRLLLELKAPKRGLPAKRTTFDYPLPGVAPHAVKIPPGTAGACDAHFYYPNSAGFAYEAAALQRCINAGLTEIPQYTLDETLATLSLIDKAKAAMNAGLKPNLALPN